MIMKNRLKETLENGRIAFGMQLRSHSPMVAEVIAASDFDYIFIETEHLACNEETLENILRAVKVHDCTPLVRIYKNDFEMISRMYDMGVMGVIIPHIETAAEAKQLVDAAHYPPKGRRGSGFSGYAFGYGLIKAKQGIEESEKHIMAIVTIESVRGVENIEEILDTGVDMIDLGLADLSLDMGLVGQPNHPDVVAMVDKVVAAAKKRGIPVSSGATTVDELDWNLKRGLSAFLLGSETAVMYASFSEMLKPLREYSERKI